MAYFQCRGHDTSVLTRRSSRQQTLSRYIRPHLATYVHDPLPARNLPSSGLQYNSIKSHLLYSSNEKDSASYVLTDCAFSFRFKVESSVGKAPHLERKRNGSARTPFRVTTHFIHTHAPHLVAHPRHRNISMSASTV